MTAPAGPGSARDAYVASRFDRLQSRFKSTVGLDDVRLAALVRALRPRPGMRLLDLGCGKGRFSGRLREMGADVIGLDVSAAMLTASVRRGIPCVLGTARRLPFGDAAFDAVVAVEVFEHLGETAAAIAEARRVLAPGGRIAILDKNAGALDVARPWLPSLALKWLDERRGLWMYPAGGPVRERWFWPNRLRRALAAEFESVEIEFLLRPEESGRRLFRAIPSTRLFVLWTARAPGGGID